MSHRFYLWAGSDGYKGQAKDGASDEGSAASTATERCSLSALRGRLARWMRSNCTRATCITDSGQSRASCPKAGLSSPTSPQSRNPRPHPDSFHPASQPKSPPVAPRGCLPPHPFLLHGSPLLRSGDRWRMQQLVDRRDVFKLCTGLHHNALIRLGVLALRRHVNQLGLHLLWHKA